MVSNLSVLLTDEKDDATLKLATVLRSNKMDVRMCAKNGAEVLKLFWMLFYSILMLWGLYPVLMGWIL